ncbi:MAG: hypothetical protein IJF76_04435 [Clostridia bacterium]|nr:hypothetical protein [Clostridia bacterium]
MEKPQIVKDFTEQIYKRLDQAATQKGLSWRKILALLEEKGIKHNKNAAYDWKIGKSDSFCNCLDELCEILGLQKSEIVYFNLSGNNTNNNIINSINESPNSTLTITENNLSKQERELVEIYRNLSLMGQMDLITYALKLKNGGQ